MTDPLQSALHHVAVQMPWAQHLLIFFATALIALLALAFVLVLIAKRHTLARGDLARITASGVSAVAITFILGHLVQDPRPFMVDHYLPLAHASFDNGFPSDHVLLATLLTGWTAWISRWWPGLLLGTFCVAAGRLGIGAHHTLDVMGSWGIAGGSLLVARSIPLKGGWRTLLLQRRSSTSVA